MKVICKLKGGFANQLLQYLFSKSISEITNRKLFIDCSDYRLFNLLQKIKRNTIQSCSIEYLSDIGQEFIISHPFHYISSFSLKNRYSDGASVDDILSDDRSVIYLDGYWHYREYLDLISPNLKDLTKKRLISFASNNVKEFISENKREVLTAVHVRRGDYLSGKYSSVYGVCSKEYYTCAFNMVESKLGTPKLMYFSDDQEWVINHLLKKNPPFVGLEKRSFIDDFVLMMSCDNYIIANSSFSWSAAFLGRNDDSVIISPLQWFKNDAMKALPLDGFFSLDIGLE